MHPPRTGAESRLGWIAITGLWANVIYWSITLIHDARLPQTYDGYRYRHGAPAAWAFPTHDVADWICAMAIEALVVSVLLRRVTGSITGICLAVGTLCGLAFLAMAPLAMHAPATFALHLVSLMFSAGWLIAMGIVSAMVMLVVRDRRASRLYAVPPEARVVSGAKPPRGA